MLSICIPIYNVHVEELVKELHRQVENVSHPIEVILIDDASELKYRQSNHALDRFARYIQLDQNIGRSAIRNAFLDHAQYDHLLFMDCDGLITKKDFLQTYINSILRYPEAVICGGRIYPHHAPKINKRLRWRYGYKSESQPAAKRSENPYASFMTNNFIVRKETLQKIQFNETLSGYGHEDTLFGFELDECNIPIEHIDNPVLNNDLETNEVYLENSEVAINNLIHILSQVEDKDKLIKDITLLNKYFQLKSFSGLVRFMFTITQPCVKWLLKVGIASITLFNFYKLGYFAKQYHQQ